MRLFLPFLVIGIFSLIFSVGVIDAVPSDAVLLRSVTAITLSRGRYTTGRRASPIPQLNCVGGPCQYQPNNVLCKNVGFDGSDVSWKCEAELTNGLKFGRVEVLCEGYSHPEDEYILRGSCGLEYTLDGYVQHSSSSYSSYTSVPPSDSSSGSWISLIVFGLIFYFIYRACSDASRPSGGGGGGGGYSGDNGPPPYGSSVGGSGGSSYYASSYSPGYSSSNCSSSSSSSSGPGFWTGVGAGALGGYLLGRNRSSAYSAPHYSTGPSFSSSSFGGGFSSSSIGTTHSTGYGGTRRR